MTIRRPGGFTLIELVTSIVILLIAVSGIMVALSSNFGRSADPMIQLQASAVAQAYLEEIRSKGFCDPDFASDCPAACTSAACGSCAGAFGAAESRATFDDVCDYDGLSDSGARDQNGSPIAMLSDYTVGVVVGSTGESLNGLSSGGGTVVRVTVNVAHPALAAPLALSVYRTNY